MNFGGPDQNKHIFENFNERRKQRRSGYKIKKEREG